MSKPTIKDIAEAANVSIATVSRALNNKNNVREATYRKIYDAMQRIGYGCIPIQYDKVIDSSNLVLVLLPNLDNPFYSKIINGIHTSAERQSYQCIIHQTNNRDYSLAELKKLIYDTRAAGLILLDPIADASVLSSIDAIIPVVQCAEYNQDSNLSFVSIDDYAASKSLINYIISKGKKRIALINGPLRFKYARMRQTGYIDALTNANLEINQNVIINLTDIGFDSAFSVISQLLTTDNPPDAIFAASDVIAAAAIKAAKRTGFTIPDSLGIVGFDNTYISTMCEPSLTTVSQPCFQIGCLSCEMLIDQIKNPLLAHKQIFLETELVIRESI